MIDFHQAFKDLLTKWGPGHVMKTAYDTAWVARLGEIDSTLSDSAFEWICDNQLEDGSWGAPAPIYYHDRVISTLSALVALTQRSHNGHSRHQIDRGFQALERIAGQATHGLMADPNGATVGFEMIVPTLLAEAEGFRILQWQGKRILGRLKQLRELKMERLNGFQIHRELSIAYSAEMAGPDCKHLLDQENLQEENGSVAYSPSATAYYAHYVRPGDPAAMFYLRRVVSKDGGTPMAAPFDVYERAWVLWNLALAGPLDAELQALCQPHLKELELSWNARSGVGFGRGYSVQDGDDTSLVYAVLTEFGHAPDIKAVYHYEEDNNFRCYALEAVPSVSANVHILDAFRRLGRDEDDFAVRKILRFLRKNQISGSYWMDKWHASPYYTTSHVALATIQYDPKLAKTAIDWIMNTQNEDGSWGFYLPTAEETAYALQALSLWRRNGGKIPQEVLRKGAHWLEEHMEPPYPPLWIAKSLYYSEWVVRTEILCGLYLAGQD